MPITITDYVSVRQRAADLGCSAPETVSILPPNFLSADTAADFLRASEAATVRTLFRLNDIPFNELLAAGGSSASYLQNNDIEWIAPTLFIPAALISQNPTVVSLALGVLANYITDFLKGRPGPKTAKLHIVIEQTGDSSCKSIHYDGDVAGIPEIGDVIRKLQDGGQNANN